MEVEVKPRFTAEIDEPVTSDIKRLIRLPLSLHGKTGLKVTPMDREELTGFDPLRDAVPDIYPESPIEVYAPRPVDVEIKGRRSARRGSARCPFMRRCS